MKKRPFLMWHIFYCAVIACFAYTYWLGAPKSSVHESTYKILNNLRGNNNYLDQVNLELIRKIDEETLQLGYEENTIIKDIAHDFKENSVELESFLTQEKKYFVESCNGLDTNFQDGRMVNDKNILRTYTFFTKIRKQDIEAKLNEFDRKSKSLINPIDSDYVKTQQISIKLYENIESLPPANAYLMLDKMINDIKLNEYSALKLCLSKLEGISAYSCAVPSLVINATSFNSDIDGFYEGGVSIVGQAFIQEKRGIAFYANDKKLFIKDGVAKLRIKPSKIGKNNVHLECRVKNPLTGGTSLIESDRYFFAVKTQE
jgi:hypothetical protein